MKTKEIAKSGMTDWVEALQTAYPKEFRYLCKDNPEDQEFARVRFKQRFNLMQKAVKSGLT